jgi:hypothetical protein
LFSILLNHGELQVPDEILGESNDLLDLLYFERPHFLKIALEILHKGKFRNPQDEQILEDHKDYSVIPNRDLLLVLQNFQLL